MPAPDTNQEKCPLLNNSAGTVAAGAAHEPRHPTSVIEVSFDASPTTDGRAPRRHDTPDANISPLAELLKGPG